MPSTSYPMKKVNKVPQRILLRLWQICDTTENYESNTDEYKNYLLAQYYTLSLVNEQLKKIDQISREDARKSKPITNQVSKIKFLTKYNPMLPKTDGIIIKKHILVLHSDGTLCFLKIALILFIKEINIWKKWFHHPGAILEIKGKPVKMLKNVKKGKIFENLCKNVQNLKIFLKRAGEWLQLSDAINYCKRRSHLYTLKKETLEQGLLQVVIMVIFVRSMWFLIIPLFVQSLSGLIL